MKNKSQYDWAVQAEQHDNDDFDDNEYDFQCCDNCDLPDACADFGCAIKMGLKCPYDDIF